MKKRFVGAILASTLLVTSLVGCGNTNTAVNEDKMSEQGSQNQSANA